mgnify:CR=1 FL=1
MNVMQIEFDPDKRDKTLAERGLDFAHVGEVFAGVNVTAEDARFDYGARHGSPQLACWMAEWLSWSGRHVARFAASSA